MYQVSTKKRGCCGETIPLKIIEAKEEALNQERREEAMAMHQRCMEQKKVVAAEAERERKQAEQRKQAEIYRVLQDNWKTSDLEATGIQNKDW